jgi:hypothetical protein
MFAALWRATIVRMAQRKKSGENRAPPTTAARAVPKTTGMVDAGSDHGRAAMIHLLRAGGEDIGAAASVMAHVYQINSVTDN